MKATETKAVVLLDTNAYRRLGRNKSDEEAVRKGRGIATRDALQRVQAIVHPFVIIELVAHLADITDPEWNDCRAALIVLWEHCATESEDGQRLLAITNDSEAAVCRLAYQQDPLGHAEISERLAYLCRRIATTGPEAAKTIGNLELSWWAQQAKEIEDDFVDDMMTHIIRDHIPDASSWEALKRDPTKRDEALEFIESSDFVNEMAAANVRKARRLLKMNPNDDRVDKDRIDLVAAAFRVAFELYRAVLRRVIVDGVDVSRTKYRNWIWDLHIAFLIGDFTVFNNRPVSFVTDDKMIVEAARTADLGDYVRSFDDYSQALRTEAG